MADSLTRDYASRVTGVNPQARGRHRVQDFLLRKGAKLLELIRERPLDTADWQVHSHGAAIAVESPKGDLFERFVLVLVRPEREAAGTFRDWSSRRVSAYGDYLERCDVGKVVRTLALEMSNIAVVMTRRGRDPSHAEWPAPASIPRVLGRFAVDIELYMRAMGDEDLRYLSAVRLIEIPKGGRRHRLALDVRNTVIGFDKEPIPLSPTALILGISNEVAARLDRGGGTAAPEDFPVSLRPVERIHRRQQERRLARRIRAVRKRIQARQPALAPMARWFESIPVSAFTPIMWTLMLLPVAVFSILGALLLLR